MALGQKESLARARSGRPYLAVLLTSAALALFAAAAMALTDVGADGSSVVAEDVGRIVGTPGDAGQDGARLSQYPAPYVAAAPEASSALAYAAVPPGAPAPGTTTPQAGGPDETGGPTTTIQASSSAPAGGSGDVAAAPTTTNAVAGATTTIVPRATTTIGPRATTTTAGTARTTTTVAAPAPVAGSGRFEVVDDTGKGRPGFVDPAGDVFVPIGAHINGDNGMWAPFPRTGNYDADAVKARDVWGWNTVQVTRWASSASPRFEELDALVAAYTSRGIVVWIDIHDFPVGDSRGDTRWNPAPFTSPQDYVNKVLPVISRYADNPYVWIQGGPFEPFFTDCTSWVDWAQPFVDQVRAAGLDNIIVIDVPDYGYDRSNVSPSCSGQLADNSGSRCNVAFSYHTYFSTPDVQDAWVDQMHGNDHAVVVGEAGFNNRGEPLFGYPHAQGVENTLHSYRNVASREVGITPWHGSAGDPGSDGVGFGAKWYDVSENGVGLNSLGLLVLDESRAANAAGLGSPRPAPASTVGGC